MKQENLTRTAQRGPSPWWYHPAIGLSMAVAVGTGSFSWDMIPYGVIVGLLLAPMALSAIVDQSNGMSMNRFGATPNARRITGSYLLGVLLVALAGILLQWIVGLPWAMAVCGALVLVLTVVCGRHIESTLLHELPRGA